MKDGWTLRRIGAFLLREIDHSSLTWSFPSSNGPLLARSVQVHICDGANDGREERDGGEGSQSSSNVVATERQDLFGHVDPEEVTGGNISAD